MGRCSVKRAAKPEERMNTYKSLAFHVPSQLCRAFDCGRAMKHTTAYVFCSPRLQLQLNAREAMINGR